MPKCDQCGADMVWQGSMKDGGLKCLNLHYEGFPSKHPQQMEDFIDRLKLTQSVPGVFQAQVPQVPQTSDGAPNGAPINPNHVSPALFSIDKVLQSSSRHGDIYLYRLRCDSCHYAGKWISHDLTQDIGQVEICPDCGTKGAIHA